ncbi:MAG: pyrroline-5-carboxylate reductase [Crocinitomicaceae bacterium]|nr:pyrroline-5-carboxylate reductase [Flavobacteriales bacterium]NQZ36856.1 pyrroline-5-carboxylate reductase [Crocinitomicaceae bacterium]PHR34990.1 MAG: pyrroline-5-carboxylate reductase [Fluviicola sp.]
MKIGIIGCGNLGVSLLKGISAANPTAKLIASRRNIGALDPKLSEIAEITSDNHLVIQQSDIIILALKPYTILSFLEEHASLFNADQHTIVSVATGVPIDEITERIPSGVGVYRAMPNTASSVNESVTMVSGADDVLNRKGDIEQIFTSLGEVIFINENLMESATILGACGIAYVLRFMRAMIQGGIEVGFDAGTATKIVAQTMKGAAELVIQNQSHPEMEIDKVTTPKGCTIVGLNEMEHAGFSSALIKGIVASYQKIER